MKNQLCGISPSTAAGLTHPFHDWRWKTNHNMSSTQPSPESTNNTSSAESATDMPTTATNDTTEETNSSTAPTTTQNQSPSDGNEKDNSPLEMNSIDQQQQEEKKEPIASPAQQNNTVVSPPNNNSTNDSLKTNSRPTATTMHRTTTKNRSSVNSPLPPRQHQKRRFPTQSSSYNNNTQKSTPTSTSSLRVKDVLIGIVCLGALLFVLYTQANVSLEPFLELKYDLSDGLHAMMDASSSSTSESQPPPRGEEKLISHLLDASSEAHVVASSQFIGVYNAQRIILLKKSLLREWRETMSPFIKRASSSAGGSAFSSLTARTTARYGVNNREYPTAAKPTQGAKSSKLNALYKKLFGLEDETSSSPFLQDTFFKWVQEQHSDSYQVLEDLSKQKTPDDAALSIVDVTLSDQHVLVFYDNWSVKLYGNLASIQGDENTSADSPARLPLSEMWHRIVRHEIPQELLSEFLEREYDDDGKRIQYVIGRPREPVLKILESQRVHQGDQGLIVVGAKKLTYLKLLSLKEAKKAEGHRLNTGEMYQDQNEDEKDLIFTFEDYADDFVLHHEADHMKTVNQQQSTDGKTTSTTAHESDHFSYYAFEIRTGQVRWKHESDDFQYGIKEHVHPQHNYKIDLNQNLQHVGEVHWRLYAEDIMQKALPHVHRHPRDTFMQEAHFKPSHMRHHKRSVSSYSSGPTTSNDAQQQYGYVGDRLHSIYENMKESRAQRESSKNEIPNVLVVHQSSGIEVLHLYTGRTLCQVTPLKRNIAYAELNHDGSINSAESTTTPQNVLRGDSADCVGEIESGSRGNSEIVYSTSICSIQSGLKRFGLSHLMQQSAAQSEGADSTPEVIAPAILQRYDGLSFKDSNDVVFLVSSGLATCLENSSGQWRIKWQVETPSRWEEATAGQTRSRDAEQRIIPTNAATLEYPLFAQVSSFRLRPSEKDSYVILVGQHHLTILDAHGNIQQVVDLPGNDQNAVVAPIQYVDVDNDGILDVVLETRQGVYVYLTNQRAGTSVLSFLLVALAMILGTMYLSTIVEFDIGDAVMIRKSKEYSE